MDDLNTSGGSQRCQLNTAVKRLRVRERCWLPLLLKLGRALRLFPSSCKQPQNLYQVSIVFPLFGETAVVSQCFPLKFKREIGAWAAKIEPLAHARRLTAVFAPPDTAFLTMTADYHKLDRDD